MRGLGQGLGGQRAGAQRFRSLAGTLCASVRSAHLVVRLQALGGHAASAGLELADDAASLVHSRVLVESVEVDLRQKGGTT